MIANDGSAAGPPPSGAAGRGEFVIEDVRSLGEARRLRDLDRVCVRTARLKHRNLYPCAIKYALWAVRPGGTIVVEDPDGEHRAPPAFSVSFNVVRMWTFKYVGASVEIVSLAPGRLELRRTAPVAPPGWSAGVVFSGSDGEIPTLLECLRGLVAQPELAPAQGGEIVVCGPARDLGFLADFSTVRYLPFETPPGPRFLVGRKKNALMRALSNSRLVMLHARVVLDPDALANAPREFDICAPNVRVRTATSDRAYLSLTQTDGVWPGVASRRPAREFRNEPSGDPLRLMEAGGVFADGGAFYVSRTVAQACPLHDDVAWEEVEDVEWCARAFLMGFLVDMAVDSRAWTQVNRLKSYDQLGPLEAPLRAGLQGLRNTRARAQDLALRWLGRR